MDVEVGCVYDVPTVMHLITGDYIPILLPAHIDGKDFCFNSDNILHYHIDVRFMQNNYDVQSYRSDYCSPVFYSKFKAICSNFDPTKISSFSAFFFVNRWYRKYKDKKIYNKKCLHQGLPLINSCGTCPGHGLIWNLENKELKHFDLPFFLELANNEIHLDENPKGQITDNEKCKIIINKSFYHDGTVIMVDTNGNRYGNMKQMLSPKDYKSGEILIFHTHEICTES